jgi:hypothetical protein
MRRRLRRGLRPTFDPLDERCLLSAGYTPSQIVQAYGLGAISFAVGGRTVPGNGAGQTIAIIDVYHDPAIASDLAEFDRKEGLPALTSVAFGQASSQPGPYLAVDNLAGSQTDDGWSQEEALDVEWAHALAPAANIVVVEAQSPSIQDLISAVQAAKSVPSVSVVSMSIGGSEFPGETSYDSVFTTPAGHTGITFVAASGDTSTPQWPASSPNVVAVGGTTLQLNSDGSYGFETTWGGTSGGSSGFEGQPSYQTALQSTGGRVTPDVAFVGDPATGVQVFATAPSNGQGTWSSVGGTSVGTPAWAGIFAVVNQGRGLAGKGTLDGPSETLPALYSLSASDFYAAAATPSGTSGSTSITVTWPVGFGSFADSRAETPVRAAGVIHDFGLFNGSAFGGAQALLGSPHGMALIDDLVAYTDPVSATPPAAASSTTTPASTPSPTINSPQPLHTHRHARVKHGSVKLRAHVLQRHRL